MLEGKDRTLAENYLKGFYQEKGKTIGLLLHGDVGTGKSFLASCVANELLKKGYSVRWLSVMQIVEFGSFYSDEQFQEYTDEIIRPDLLIIDDLGAERGTEYALSRVFNLIDTRATSDKPMIVTTNVRVKEMGKCDDLRRKRTFDRVLEKCFPYAMVGVSKRMLSAKENYNRYRDMLLGE